MILLDVKMPVMDGLTAAKLIAQAGGDVAVIMMTAYNDKQFVDKAGDFGALGYLVKPIDEKSLTPTIEIALRRRKELTELKIAVAGQEKKLEERKIIEKAKGILIKNNSITEDEAYKYLRTVSMNKRKSIVEVAKIIIDTENMLH